MSWQDMRSVEAYVLEAEQIPGWAHHEDAIELARTGLSLPTDAVIVEIGPFAGAATILLAGARNIAGSGWVHVVGEFDCSAAPLSPTACRNMLADVGHSSLREHFAANIRRAGVDSRVEVHQGNPLTIATSWHKVVDLMLIEGAVEPELSAAYKAWASFLKPDGILVIHNSAPNDHPERDPHWCFVEEQVCWPRYTDIRSLSATTLARKLAPPPARVFSYWDKPDLTPIQATLADWGKHFPDFTIFGDADVEPILQDLFPEHVEMFRRIRIPSGKSDVALLLALYRHGGLHIDCHCGVRDAEMIRQLLYCLNEWEMILYDKKHARQPRPATKIHPLNSVLFARQNSPIVLETLKTVLGNLAEHWTIERRFGFRPYHVGALTLPGGLFQTLLVEPWAPISRIKPEYVQRVRFLPEGDGEPIGRYMHYSYREPGMHWSERQQREMLFA